MNNQILLFVLCILIIMIGYLGFKEIRKLNIKIVEIENSIKIEKDSIHNSSKLHSVYNREILENNTLEVSQSIKCNVKSIDKQKFQVICTLSSDSE